MTHLPFNWDILCSIFWSKIMFSLCVPATKEKWTLFLNHRNRKVIGGKHNVLVQCTRPIWCCPLKPFQMRYFVVHFWSKIMFFVGATTVKCILFLNHRNRKVVGDKHNILVHCVNVCAHDPSGVFFCNLFKWDILWFIISDHESCYFCVCNNSKVVGDKHNVLVHYVNVCAPLIYLVLSSATLANEIFCRSLFLIQNHVVVCVPAITL